MQIQKNRERIFKKIQTIQRQNSEKLKIKRNGGRIFNEILI